MGRARLVDVQTSGFDEVVQIRLELVQELVRAAMWRDLVSARFPFARGDDRRPRRVYRPIALPDLEVESSRYATPRVVDLPPSIRLLPELLPAFAAEPDADPPEPAVEPALDTLWIELPMLRKTALPDAPTPLPAGPQFVDAALPVGLRPIDAGLLVTFVARFDTARLREAGHAIDQAVYLARVVLRPYLDDGVVRLERWDLTLSPQGDTAAPEVDAIARPEVTACLLAAMRSWCFATTVAGGSVRHARFDPDEPDVLVLGVGDGNPSQLYSCLEAHETFGAVFAPAVRDVASALADRLVEGFAVLETRTPYHAWSVALATEARTDPAIGDGGALLAVRAQAVVRGRVWPVRVTSVHRRGGRIHSLAFDHRFHLTVERAHALISTGQLSVVDTLQFVARRERVYVRDVPDGDRADNLSVRPRFDPRTTSMIDANQRPDFPVRPGLYRYRRDAAYDQGRGAHGRPDALEAYPAPPDAVVIQVHGVWTHQVATHFEAMPHVLRTAVAPERMERVWFLRMYWGNDPATAAADGPGERVDQWEGLSDRAWAGAAKLMRLVSSLRERLGAVPITLVSHSNGAAVTLVALQEGLRVDNWVIMGSPLSVENVRTGDDNTHLAAAAANVRGQVLHLWSPDDGTAGFVKVVFSGTWEGTIGTLGLPRVGRGVDGWLDGVIAGVAGLPVLPDGSNFDISGYPRDDRPNIEESRVTSEADCDGFDHGDYWRAFWLRDDRVKFSHPAMPQRFVDLVLGDNLPAWAPSAWSLAEQRELAAWRTEIAQWATTETAWWTDDGNLTIWDHVVLLPGLMTTFHVDDAHAAWARLYCEKGRLQLRLREAVGWDESWASPWYDATPAQHAWAERVRGGADATFLVEVRNPTDEIIRGKLYFDTRE